MSKNITRRAALVGTLALASGLALFGCGGASDSAKATDNADKTEITIAATSTPHGEVLNDVVVPLLEEKGYTVKVLIEDDYSIPNKQLAEGEVDANYFQHKPYLDSEVEEFGYEISAAISVHYEPFGIYAGSKSDLKDIAEGDKIAIPNDTTNEARALLLLAQAGLIEVDEKAGITATPKDITSNPLNLEFIETDAEMISHVLEDVAFGVINGNYALEAGLNPSEDALEIEDPDGIAGTTYANFVAVRTADLDAQWAKDLCEAITSQDVRDYINKNYEGAVLPVF